MRPAGLTVPGTVLCRASCILLLLCLICSTITSSPLERKRSPIDTELANAKGRRHRQPKMRRSGKGDSGEGHPAPEPGQAEIVRLLDAFGLKTVPRPNRTAVATPPAFMVNLYHQLESTVGSGHHTANARANTVRSFNEKDSKSSRHRYLFDTSSVLNRETVLAAELQLYKQKPRPVDGWTDDMLPRQVTCELYELRQRVNPLLGGPPVASRTLVDSKTVNFTLRGWVHFNVSSAFAGSVHLVSADKLFEMRIKSERELPKGTVVFSKRPRPKHTDRRPLLVLFLDDKNVLASDITLPGAGPLSSQDSGRNKELSGNRENEKSAPEASPERGMERSDRRKRRASSRTGNRGRDKCKLYDYYVDFNVIGWSNWVIAPNGYTANYCEGDCPFPLDLNFNATNHATVQAILHMHTGTFRNNNRRLPNPCCVPATLAGIHVLYLDDLDNVVLKEFSGMIATSCGCQ
ncbi:bone morphogenetic protein 2-like [Patiria miniata]|uniref:TGF-beta family profile domain-containing protein n=1 Tax=Patiria miniata TaxID=46514 RepID=A0A914B4M9_PATMI|nr:bone morphogenetic protein 2-like [Patiria miniata]